MGPHVYSAFPLVNRDSSSAPPRNSPSLHGVNSSPPLSWPLCVLLFELAQKDACMRGRPSPPPGHTQLRTWPAWAPTKPAKWDGVTPPSLPQNPSRWSMNSLFSSVPRFACKWSVTPSCCTWSPGTSPFSCTLAPLFISPVCSLDFFAGLKTECARPCPLQAVLCFA